jgi:pyruvate formate lyase activating enzyme
VRLKGWVRTSLIDFPGRIATVLFTGGCDFRCPMCHNADLVLRPQDVPDLPEEEVWAFLSRRTRLIDGVVITGGEPTLQPDLIPFVQQIRALSLNVKLDTNGYRPDVLAALLGDGLVDYVAMDVKAPPEKYPCLTGRPDLDVARVVRSVALLRKSDVSYEFRTTVVPGWLTGADIEEIARWVSGARRYVVQQFRPFHTLEPALERVTPYPADRLYEMVRCAARWVAQAAVRGV